MIESTEPLVDLLWEGWPNWIMAVTSFLTLIAAGIAAYFAGRAAHWTKQQATSSDAQAKTAEHQLAVAQRSIDANDARTVEQRDDLVRAERRQAESRLDALAPALRVVATRYGVSSLEAGETGTSVNDTIVLEWGRDFLVRLSAQLDIDNVSGHLAFVSIHGHGYDEIRAADASWFLLAPGEKRRVQWHRRIHTSELRREGVIDAPETWLIRLSIDVEDLGRNTHDTLQVQLDYRYFKLDGSRLIIDPRHAPGLDQTYGEVIAPRTYPRLDASPPETIG